MVLLKRKTTKPREIDGAGLARGDGNGGGEAREGEGEAAEGADPMHS